MTPESEQLYALAAHVAAPFIQLPAACAAMVTGSVAKGIADQLSDIDMSIFYSDTLPAEEQLSAIRDRLGGTFRWGAGSHAEGVVIGAFELAGLEVQMIHTTVAAWEATMAEVQTKLTVDTPLAKALEGIAICRPLYGAEWIERWKAQAAQFPPALGEAMVRHYLQFFPIWGLQEHFARRDATVWYYQVLAESAFNLVGVLSGLNGVYFTKFQFKRMGRFIAGLGIAPPNLPSRIEALFTLPPVRAAAALEQLIDETLHLVEQHMPQIDISAARRRIGWRAQPWNPAAVQAVIGGG
ncbi:MAG: hypothetical protein HC822_21840 [Oscillochloris sp.]|nr:hypothetical protein [Oscillochloris sp.]